MTKVPTTLMIDEEILRAVKARSVRTGQPVAEIIEDVLRRELGFDLLDRLWRGDDLGEEPAITLAVEAQHNTRSRP